MKSTATPEISHPHKQMRYSTSVTKRSKTENWSGSTTTRERGVRDSGIESRARPAAQRKRVRNESDDDFRFTRAPARALKYSQRPGRIQADAACVSGVWSDDPPHRAGAVGGSARCAQMRQGRGGVTGAHHRPLMCRRERRGRIYCDMCKHVQHLQTTATEGVAGEFWCSSRQASGKRRCGCHCNGATLP